MALDAETRKQIAEAYSKEFSSKLSESLIQSNLKKMEAVDSSDVDMNLKILSLLIYTELQAFITVGTNNYEFDGTGWGISIPGGGNVWGSLSSDNFNTLTSSTTSFWITFLTAYTGMFFHADDGTLLGTFNGGQFGTVLAGTMHGNGSWRAVQL